MNRRTFIATGTALPFTCNAASYPHHGAEYTSVTEAEFAKHLSEMTPSQLSRFVELLPVGDILQGIT
ncbi:MAG: hypothetical protein JKX71_11340 [Amylibacter sp.]|nr:hypothetical protein [Amylibacter sp.]